MLDLSITCRMQATFRCDCEFFTHSLIYYDAGSNLYLVALRLVFQTTPIGAHIHKQITSTPFMEMFTVLKL